MTKASVTENGKRIGRLSKEEWVFIEENWKSMSLSELCEEMNRDVLPVKKYIQKLEALESNPLDKSDDFQALRRAGYSVEHALASLNIEDENTNIKIDFSKIDQLYGLIESLEKQVTDLKQSINDNILDWRNKAWKEGEDRIAARETMLGFNTAIQTKSLADKHNMPDPPSPICKFDEIKDQGLKGVSGVYFAWNNFGSVVYVGRSSDLHKRLISHSTVTDNHLISWLEFPESKIYTYELFYIWLLEPSLNNETKLSIKAQP